MKVTILGSVRKGKKSFILPEEKGFCYSITALNDKGERTKYKNIISIEWEFEGLSVICRFTDGRTETLSFDKYIYDQVIIRQERCIRLEQMQVSGLSEPDIFLFGGVQFEFIKLIEDFAKCRISNSSPSAYCYIHRTSIILKLS